MNTILLVQILIVLGIILIPLLILVSTRQGKNLIKKIVFNKKYVIVHLKRDAVDFEEVWYVVPAPDYYTKVGTYDYSLNPQYALMRWKGRLHYYVSESDAVPKYLSRNDSTTEILMQVQEIKTALHNRSYEFLYGKKQNLALIISLVACAIAIVVAIYGAYEIQKIEPILQWLYDHPPVSPTGNVSVVGV